MTAPSRSRKLANNVVNWIQGQTWTQSFTVERCYDLPERLSEVEGLRVRVVCNSFESPVGQTRKLSPYTAVIGLLISKPLPPKWTTADADAVEDIVDEIAARFENLILPQANCTTVRRTQLWSPQSLDQTDYYLAPVDLEWRLWL
jgi:hypothetical protein